MPSAHRRTRRPTPTAGLALALAAALALDGPGAASAAAADEQDPSSLFTGGRVGLQTPHSTLGAATPPNRLGWLLVGARAGGLFGQPFSALGASLLGELSAGLHPSFWEHRLGLVLAASYAQPKATETVFDPRLTGGQTTWRTTVSDLGLSISPALWYPVGARLIPYAQVGPKLHLYRFETDGSAGAAAFGAHREPRARLGWAGRLGLALRLGPGAVTADVTFDTAPVEETITGKANAGDLALSLGYSLILFEPEPRARP